MGNTANGRVISPTEAANRVDGFDRSFEGSFKGKNFPMYPPGSTGDTGRARNPNASGSQRDIHDGSGSFGLHTGPSGISHAGPFSQSSTKSLGNFMQNTVQLNSKHELSKVQLMYARSLNRMILDESQSADLVVTNLPDMPSGESGYGYFQLIDEMTKGLQRCLLVRGTSTEVITAFT